MGRIGAFGIVMWMSGLAIGVGASLEEWGRVGLGGVLAVFCIAYYRQFMRSRDA